ncbi:MAG: DUF192 domain-containing protein [Clostridia bacterium]|nr:DUF192 domain-containing protein [Clostridia bacterium]
MKKISVINNNNVITRNAESADNFFSRFRGLMFRKAIDDDYVLHITPCNQIHMLNMRFAIDVVYLSETGEVIKTDKSVQPGKICKTVKGAKSVLEMKSFAAEKFGISVGDKIKITVRD